MTWSRFPCFECAAPFDDEEDRDEHQRAARHGPAQVQLDAIDRARWGVMGDDAPPPESAYADDVGKSVMQHTVARRRNLRVIPGGRR